MEDVKTVTEADAPPISFGRLPGETDKAFAAFRKYMKLGPDRSIRKLGRKCGKWRATFEKWSSKYQWQERAAAFDDHLTQIQQTEIEEHQRKDARKWADRLEQHRETRFRIGTLLLKRAEAALRGKRKLEPGAADRLAKVGDMMIGLAVGAPTANLSVGGTSDADAIPVVASVGTVNVFLPDKRPLPDEKEFQEYQAKKT